MSKGIGKAFEKAVSIKSGLDDSKEKTRKDESILASPTRQGIYQYLCSHPGAYLSKIAEANELALHTAKWHLKKLAERDYISQKKSGKRSLFYPTGMIDPEDLPLFELLNIDKAKKIYIHILAAGGLSQRELSDAMELNHQAVIWYIQRLTEVGLVSTVEDGKYVRYFPTEKLSKRRDVNYRRLKSFTNGILKKLKAEGLEPEIVRATSGVLILNVKGSAKGKKLVMNIQTDPFTSVLG